MTIIGSSVLAAGLLAAGSLPVPSPAQERAVRAAPAALQVTATPVARKAAVEIRVMNPRNGERPSTKILQLRLGDEVVGQVEMQLPPPGEERRVVVPVSRPGVAREAARLALYAGNDWIGGYQLPRRAPPPPPPAGKKRPPPPAQKPPPAGLSPLPEAPHPTLQLAAIHFNYFPPAGMEYDGPIQHFAKHDKGPQWFMPLPDVPRGETVYVDWAFTATDETLEDALEGSCCFEFLLNGAPVPNVKPLGGPKSGQLRVISPFSLHTGGWPKTIVISFEKNGRKHFSWPVVLKQGRTVSYFEKFIFGMFKHDRCSTCHLMGDTEALIAQHQKAGHGIPSNVEPQKTEPCVQCHIQDWRSPRFDQGIDWTGKNARQICLTVNQKLPTVQDKKHHFHEDPRIKWAAVNDPPYPDKEPATTGTFQQFLARVDAWIGAGSPCPPASYPAGS